MTGTYTKEDVLADYDKGYSIEEISKRYKKSQEIDFENKMSSKKAYEEVCKMIYEFIMKRGSIVKRS